MHEKLFIKQISSERGGKTYFANPPAAKPSKLDIKRLAKQLPAWRVEQPPAKFSYKQKVLIFSDDSYKFNTQKRQLSNKIIKLLINKLGFKFYIWNGQTLIRVNSVKALKAYQHDIQLATKDEIVSYLHNAFEDIDEPLKEVTDEVDFYLLDYFNFNNLKMLIIHAELPSEHLVPEISHFYLGINVFRLNHNLCRFDEHYGLLYGDEKESRATYNILELDDLLLRIKNKSLLTKFLDYLTPMLDKIQVVSIREISYFKSTLSDLLKNVFKQLTNLRGLRLIDFKPGCNERQLIELLSLLNLENIKYFAFENFHFSFNSLRMLLSKMPNLISFKLLAGDPSVLQHIKHPAKIERLWIVNKHKKKTIDIRSFKYLTSLSIDINSSSELLFFSEQFSSLKNLRIKFSNSHNSGMSHHSVIPNLLRATKNITGLTLMDTYLSKDIGPVYFGKLRRINLLNSKFPATFLYNVFGNNKLITEFEILGCSIDEKVVKQSKLEMLSSSTVLPQLKHLCITDENLALLSLLTKHFGNSIPLSSLENLNIRYLNNRYIESNRKHVLDALNNMLLTNLRALTVETVCDNVIGYNAVQEGGYLNVKAEMRKDVSNKGYEYLLKILHAKIGVKLQYWDVVTDGVDDYLQHFLRASLKLKYLRSRHVNLPSSKMESIARMLFQFDSLNVSEIYVTEIFDHDENIPKLDFFRTAYLTAKPFWYYIGHNKQRNAEIIIYEDIFPYFYKFINHCIEGGEKIQKWGNIAFENILMLEFLCIQDKTFTPHFIEKLSKVFINLKKLAISDCSVAMSGPAVTGYFKELGELSIEDTLLLFDHVDGTLDSDEWNSISNFFQLFRQIKAIQARVQYSTSQREPKYDGKFCFPKNLPVKNPINKICLFPDLEQANVLYVNLPLLIGTLAKKNIISLYTGIYDLLNILPILSPYHQQGVLPTLNINPVLLTLAGSHRKIRANERVLKSVTQNAILVRHDYSIMDYYDRDKVSSQTIDMRPKGSYDLIEEETFAYPGSYTEIPICLQAALKKFLTPSKIIRKLHYYNGDKLIPISPSNEAVPKKGLPSVKAFFDVHRATEDAFIYLIGRHCFMPGKHFLPAPDFNLRMTALSASEKINIAYDYSYNLYVITVETHCDVEWVVEVPKAYLLNQKLALLTNYRIMKSLFNFINSFESKRVSKNIDNQEFACQYILNMQQGSCNQRTHALLHFFHKVNQLKIDEILTDDKQCRPHESFSIISQLKPFLTAFLSVYCNITLVSNQLILSMLLQLKKEICALSVISVSNNSHQWVAVSGYDLGIFSVDLGGSPANVINVPPPLSTQLEEQEAIKANFNKAHEKVMKQRDKMENLPIKYFHYQAPQTITIENKDAIMACLFSESGPSKVTFIYSKQTQFLNVYQTCLVMAKKYDTDILLFLNDEDIDDALSVVSLDDSGLPQVTKTGPLANYFKHTASAHSDTSKYLLFNLTGFKSHALSKLNSLLDDNGLLLAEKLVPNTKIFVFIDEVNFPQLCLSEDFCSRIEATMQFDCSSLVPEHDHHSLSPLLDGSAETISMYGEKNITTAILGDIGIDETGKFAISPGLLAKHSRLILCDVPATVRNESLRLRLNHESSDQQIIFDTIVNDDSYISARYNYLSRADIISDPENYHVLSTSSFALFFGYLGFADLSSLRFSDAVEYRTVKQYKGLIQQAAKRNIDILNIIVIDNLPKTHWRKLLNEAELQGIVLSFAVTEGVDVPFEVPPVEKISPNHMINNYCEIDKALHETFIIASSDLRYWATQFSKDQSAICVPININTVASDLTLVSKDFRSDEFGSQIAVRLSPIFVALLDSHDVILYGTASADLLRDIATLFMPKPHLILWGMRFDITGRLIIITPQLPIILPFCTILNDIAIKPTITESMQISLPVTESPIVTDAVKIEELVNIEDTLLDDRLSLILEKAKYSPVIFIEGVPGSGKSYFTHYLQSELGWCVYFDKMKFLRSNPDPGEDNYSVLIVDEVNVNRCSDFTWDLAGLLLNRQVLAEANLFSLSQMHIVLCLGNANTLAHRQQQVFVEQYPECVIYFSELPLNTLYQRILMPKLVAMLPKDNFDEHLRHQIAINFLLCYQHFRADHPKTVVGPRNLNSMLSYFRYLLTDDVIERYLVTKRPDEILQRVFVAALKSLLGIQSKVTLTNDIYTRSLQSLSHSIPILDIPKIKKLGEIYLTQQHYEMIECLTIAIDNAIRRRAGDASLAPQHLLFEGESGLAKTSIIRAFMATTNFIELSPSKLLGLTSIHELDSNKNYYVYLPANSDMDMSAAINNAYRFGIALILDEANTISSEMYLLGPLSGDQEVAMVIEHPGFMVIMAQNPSGDPRYLNRIKQSPAFYNRIVSRRLSPYTATQYQEIAERSGLAHNAAVCFVKEFEYVNSQREKSHLPRFTSRHFFAKLVLAIKQQTRAVQSTNFFSRHHHADVASGKRRYDVFEYLSNPSLSLLSKRVKTTPSKEGLWQSIFTSRYEPEFSSFNRIALKCYINQQVIKCLSHLKLKLVTLSLADVSYAHADVLLAHQYGALGDINKMISANVDSFGFWMDVHAYHLADKRCEFMAGCNKRYQTIRQEQQTLITETQSTLQHLRGLIRTFIATDEAEAVSESPHHPLYKHIESSFPDYDLTKLYNSIQSIKAMLPILMDESYYIVLTDEAGTKNVLLYSAENKLIHSIANDCNHDRIPSALHKFINDATCYTFPRLYS